MKIFPAALCTLMLSGAITVYADSLVTTTVDGKRIDKELTKITFDEGTATLTFSDNSVETADMTLVTVTLDHSTQSAIDAIIADPAKTKGIYNILGQYLGENTEGLTPGIYIVNGKKVYVK